MPTILAPPLYATRDVARRLHLSETRVAQLVRAGVATPSVPVGDPPRQRLFTPGDVEALAEKIGRPLRRLQTGGDPEAA